MIGLMLNPLELNHPLGVIRLQGGGFSLVTGIRHWNLWHAGMTEKFLNLFRVPGDDKLLVMVRYVHHMDRRAAWGRE